MSTALLDYVQMLQNPPELPSFEPELDDLDQKKYGELQELDDLSAGAIRKATVQPGRGGPMPTEGDLVYIHLAVTRQSGEVLSTTRPDQEGSGVPIPFVLGKGRRAPRGWELAVSEMTQGERIMLMLQPEYSYAQKGCRFQPPKGYPADADFLFDIQLAAIYPAKDIKVVGSEEDIFKRSTKEALSWATPRRPFEVSIEASARVPSSSGQHGMGQPLKLSPGHSNLQPAAAREATSSCSLRTDFTVGSGAVPAGLEEAVCSLSRGERAVFSCPAASLRSSPDSMWVLPPDLQYIELDVILLAMIEVRDMTGDGGVVKRRVKDGIGDFPTDCPLEDCAVQIHYRVLLPGSQDPKYDSRGPGGKAAPFEFDTGMGLVPEAVDMAVRLMTPQEVSTVAAQPKYAYQGRSDRPPEVPVGSPVVFELELVSFQRQQHWTSMAAADKIRRAQELKAQGNAVYKAGLTEQARAKWQKAMKMLGNLFDIETAEQDEEASGCKASCMVNLALLDFKAQRYSECFTWCERALKESPDHPKAIYRRGMAHAALNSHEAAAADFELVKKLDPSTQQDMDRELRRLKQGQAAGTARQKQQMQNFFGRSKAG